MVLLTSLIPSQSVKALKGNNVDDGPEKSASLLPVTTLLNLNQYK